MATELTVQETAPRSGSLSPPLARERLRASLVALPAVTALVLGTAGALLVMRHYPLDPDVLEYEAIARALTWSSILGGAREPLWPLVLYVPVHLFPANSAPAIRMVGVAGFVFMVVSFQLLCRSLFGRGRSIAAAMVLAASPWFVYQATRGLREETATGLVLLFALALLAPKLGRMRFVLLFGLAGVTGLLRWDEMEIMLGALVIALFVRRPPAVVWIAGPALLAAVVAPLLIANTIQTGDPMYHSDIHAVFYRNFEFHDRPGFVTSAQMAVSSYAGPPITWTQYIFGLHSPGELLKRAVVAFWTVPTRLTVYVLLFPQAPFWPASLGPALAAVGPVVAAVAWVLSVAGGFMLLRSRAWPVPVMLGGIIVLYSPIADLIEYRLVMTAFPLALLCAIGVQRFRRRASGLEC